MGDTADKAKANTTCAADEDRCYTKTEGDVVMTKCFAIKNLEYDKMTDKACKTDSNIKICLCDTNNCNDPTGAAGYLTRSNFVCYSILNRKCLQVARSKILPFTYIHFRK